MLKIKKITALAIYIIGCATAYCAAPAVSPLVVMLDSVLTASGRYEQTKLGRIDQLLKKKSSRLNDEEGLWLNKMLYDEYSVYKADSAMTYVDSNIEIAGRLGRPSLEEAWKINKVFLLAAQGLLSEAEKEISQIDEAALADENRYAYYETSIYLYTHLSQYIGRSDGMSEKYDSIANSQRREALQYIDASHPAFYSLKAAMLSGPDDPDWQITKTRLREVVDQMPLNNRTSAINAYGLAKMYLAEGDEKGHIDNLMKSAIADIRTSNRDIASLEELAGIFYDRGDIDRGYAYINHCLKASLLYPNRVRVVNISAVMDKLQAATEERNIEQSKKTHNLLLLVSILSGILILVIIVIIYQFRKLKQSHAKLMASESNLSERIQELDDTQQRLKNVNLELTDTNEKLRQSNEKLIRSNYVKEVYVGYVFSVCSSYLTKMEEFRKNIARKLTVGQISDVKAITSSERIGQAELTEFYRRFDTIFLHLYPGFVEDFNKLMRPEERIILKKGELLNTELRIYALIRLGINNSVEIAEFLHMSSQTVYNCRLKVRNKAAVPKQEFAALVRVLGTNSASTP